MLAAPAQAAKSAGCAGAGYRLVNLDDRRRRRVGRRRADDSGCQLGAKFAVRGKYNEFNVRSADFAVLDYAFTGAASTEDITGGVRTPGVGVAGARPSRPAR